MSMSADQLDKIAAEYHSNDSIPDIHIENLCKEYFAAWLVKQVQPGSRVLEMGYGDGLMTQALLGTGCNLTVIEGSGVLVQNARNRHAGITCEMTMFEDYRPVRPFDLVIASHVLEHVDDPVAILKRISSWMSDDAKLIAAVPNKNSIHRRLAVAMGLQPLLETLSGRDRLVGHQRVYCLESLEGDLNSAGMRLIDSAGFFLKVFPYSMMLEYSTQLLKGLNEVSSSLPKDLMANIAVVAKKGCP